MITVSVVAGQALLGSEIVHTNIFVPVDNPVTPEVGLLGEVTLPVPATTVQVPIPGVGVLPAKVAVVLLHID